jgi:hypothetical protein
MHVQPAIDLSASLGPVRCQGQRSTCMAFAMSDLNRSASAAPEALSAEFLYRAAGALTPAWSPGKGLRTMEAIQATHAPGQPLEIHFPYASADPAGADHPVAPAGRALFTSRFDHRPFAMQSLVSALERGHVVGLVTRVTLGLFTPTDGVVPHDVNVLPGQYHAMLAVGWGIAPDSGVGHLLVRNSWSDAWGLAGHAWLPEPFVNLHVIEAFGR